MEKRLIEAIKYIANVDDQTALGYVGVFEDILRDEVIRLSQENPKPVLLEPDFVTGYICKRMSNDKKQYSISDLRLKARKTGLKEVRHMCAYFLYNYSLPTLKQVGEELGGRDHATIINSIEWVEYEKKFNKGGLFVLAYNDIESLFKEELDRRRSDLNMSYILKGYKLDIDQYKRDRAA